MGFLSGLFKKRSDTVTQEPLIPSWQLQTGQQLANWLQGNLERYTPGEAYGGRLSVTQPSAGEQQGLGLLESFLGGSPTGDLYAAGKQQLLDTLGGKFADPRTSPFLESMRDVAGMNLQDTIDQSRRSAGARGNYFSRAAIQDENRLRERSGTQLNAIIGDWLNRERERQYGATQPALAYEKYAGMDVPLARLGAAESQLSALPRLLEQADLEKQYTAWQNQRQELSAIPQMAQGMYGTNVPYGIQSYTQQRPSIFSQIFGQVNPLVGSYNQARYGTPGQMGLQDALKLAMSMYGGGAGGFGGGLS